MDLVFLSRGRDLTKTTVSIFNKNADWLSILPSSMVSLCMNLIYVRCLVLYFKFYRIYLSTKPTKFDGIFISHNSTKHLYTFPAKLLCVSIGKYETMRKTTNVTTNLAVTLRLSWPYQQGYNNKTVTTKFVVTAVTTKLVVSAYF